MSERPTTPGGPVLGRTSRGPAPAIWFPPGLGKAAELITIQIMDALTLS